MLGVLYCYCWATPPEGEEGGEERFEVDVAIVVNVVDEESVTVDEEVVESDRPDSNSDEGGGNFPRPFPNFGCKRPI